MTTLKAIDVIVFVYTIPYAVIIERTRKGCSIMFRKGGKILEFTYFSRSRSNMIVRGGVTLLT